MVPMILTVFLIIFDAGLVFRKLLLSIMIVIYRIASIFWPSIAVPSYIYISVPFVFNMNTIG
jgi:hypothetical protein